MDRAEKVLGMSGQTKRSYLDVLVELISLEVRGYNFDLGMVNDLKSKVTITVSEICTLISFPDDPSVWNLWKYCKDKKISSPDLQPRERNIRKSKHQ